MGYLIAYSSAGGNTKRVAEAVARAMEERGLDAQTLALTAETVNEAQERAVRADAVLVGFWCDKGDCVPEVSALLAGLTGRRVFLFGTAGFGGSPEYFDRILARVREHLPKDACYLGGAMCQGKMGEGVRARYEAMLAEKPGDARIQAMIDNFDAARSHPDDADLEAIASAALAAVAQA